MAIAALSNASSSPYFQSSSNLNAEQNSLESLGRSLSSNSVAGAQTAFKQLQTANNNLGSLGGASAPSAQTTADISALGTALSKGDLAGSKTAFATVQTDLANVNAQAISAAVASANQEVQQIDALLGTVDSSGSSAAGSTTTDVANLTTSLLSTVYGNHASAAANGGASTGGKVNVSA